MVVSVGGPLAMGGPVCLAANPDVGVCIFVVGVTMVASTVAGMSMSIGVSYYSL